MTATIEHARPRPMPHPRIRERRIKVRRDEGRRRLRRLVTLAAVGAMVLGGLAATRSSLLDVDRVTVSGGRHTPAEAVVDAAAVRDHQPMVEVDTAGAVERIETLPWVDRADVVRRWPGVVRIEIEERAAVAQVVTADGPWMLIDAGGRLLQRNPAPVERLVRLTNPISGAPGDDLGRRLTSSRLIAAAIRAPLDQRITDINEHDSTVELRLADGGGKVLFGSAEDVPEKLRALEQLLTTGPRLCPIWDVRVPSAPVLTPGNGCV